MTSADLRRQGPKQLKRQEAGELPPLSDITSERAADLFPTKEIDRTNKDPRQIDPRIFNLFLVFSGRF